MLGRTEIIGRENILQVRKENIEEAITEKDRTIDRVITQGNRIKRMINKKKQEWNEKAETPAEWGTILVQHTVLCYLSRLLQFLYQEWELHSTPDLTLNYIFPTQCIYVLRATLK